ncbi:hypothetical protein VP01_3038g1 [Puccinia sorghi]|uniref:Uncharacterized protein n=1 Tax=Puccinia sorghi TaxID=27349 RepID=A0A0L6V0S4_9BASI|nr:hypothetical protein VP01_3038g1 [Puccinia sorghi]
MFEQLVESLIGFKIVKLKDLFYEFKIRKLYNELKEIIKKHDLWNFPGSSGNGPLVYLCGFYIKQSLGTIFKTHIFKHSFNTLNLDQSCSNGNGLQNLCIMQLTSFKKNLFKLTIHEVWKTKGNYFGFIRELVSFIFNHWNYVFKHFSLKVVAWYHKGSLLEEPIVNLLEKNGLVMIKVIDKVKIAKWGIYKGTHQD